ncbi:MAG TPA: uroporphyrinogen-III C-methyltransferase [Syntrophales bacterium]|jgi:uroporphyrinogen III methyltransferase/synthase|nr:uroporphyrinogen-III C-methyltransferase [Syntrophales bacterium]HOU77373.1 uroporphyrinogen-III C-methyltransferase [Syntrophales bacterium]HPC32505.1 uroporphyrinogen-III C-methyltransferase [Syntrophales bacterium]HRR47010.1 uroporphyrinogen-III C-methyltransferase [Syntrophales bacterium]HRU87927.1 uroporphyrinogen-III C-methyltransferase [Syntrophales bacterium]
MTETGKVYIIGAGPGDPDLITVKGVRAIGRAGVIVYDHLVSEELLAHARKDARLIYAGKKGGDHTLPQTEINRLLVAEARAGHIVARLKGGDPFIFGRGGEEAETLAAAGIPFEVIPGVTAAVAVPAYAGIPLTHRGLTSTVAFVTGHEDPTKEKSDIDWAALAGIGTLVFFMGVKNLPRITAALREHGKDPQTPAALIRWGTTADQETVTGSLADIAALAAARGFTPPSLLVVGPVTGLRETLRWFDNRPLFGRGVVITRPETQAESFAALLREEGARPIPFPTIRIVPPETWTELDAALERLPGYAWIVFTSANGVRYFLARLRERGGDLRELRGIRIATIGPATAGLLAQAGIKADLVPAEYISEGVVRAFADHDIRGKKILLPRAAAARDVIPAGLAALGAQVDVVTVYRTVAADRRPEELIALIAAGKVDVITFTSPSTVTNFLAIMGPAFSLPATVKIAAIGPVTAAALQKAGLAVDILQKTYTIPGLVAGLRNHFARPG